MAEKQPADSNFVILTEEPNPMRAHWVAGAVEEAGIPTFVDEDNLADEFAMSQKVMGLLRVRVLVPADRLEEARTVFLGLSQPIPLIDEDEDDDLDEMVPRDPSAWMFWVVLPFVILGAGAAVVTTWRSCSGTAPSPDAFDEGPGEPPRPPPPHPLHR